MNWDDVRFFLAVHRAGTLRGAAEQLNSFMLIKLPSGAGLTRLRRRWAVSFS